MLNDYKLNLRYIDYKEKQHQGRWIAQDTKVGVSGDQSPLSLGSSLKTKGLKAHY
jgi:hypothetical protein